MNNKYYIFLIGILILFSCQKMDRPVMRPIIENPTPPPYNALKSLYEFENNVTDKGENGVDGTVSNTSYVAGISGQGIKIGADGYVLSKAIGDSVIYPNEFVGIPADTLANLGSFTVAFWMNGVGPVTGGAQGVFAISNNTQFWGNLEIFLENYDAGGANAAFFKVHLFNANISGGGEQWIADDAMKFSNALNKWTHVAFTYDAATSGFKSYIDGALKNERILNGGNYGKIKFNNFNGMVIGSFAFQTNPSLTNHGPEGWAKSFNGSLDQFRLYNRSLSATEIAELNTTKK